LHAYSLQAMDKDSLERYGAGTGAEGIRSEDDQIRLDGRSGWKPKQAFDRRSLDERNLWTVRKRFSGEGSSISD
jgi:hypothetical protein